MKKILMTMAAVSALSIGAPAAAQYAGGDMHARVQQLDAQLQAGVRSGAISRREARPLDQQIRQISQYERVNGRDGLSMRERTYLQQRIANLRQHIRYAEQTGNGRDARYGRADRYDDGRGYGANDNAYGRDGYARDQRLDRNGDGWDDRDLDHDGRIENARDERLDRNGDGWDDRDLDRDGRIENAREEEAGYLRVGQRISGNFGEMPAQYRDRYRDDAGSYYRYDRGNVYQVDARTDLILRIFAGQR
jgi:hypothetical protein